MKKPILLCLTILCLLASTAWHKFYLSVTQADYNEKDKALQMTTKLFYDDLEDALQERYDKEIRIDKSYDQKKLDAYIGKYMNNRVAVDINGQKRELNYLGHKIEDDYVVCYVEVSAVNKTPTSIEIENKLLMDVFDEQKNVVHLTVGQIKKSFLLTADNPKDKLKL